VSVGFAGTGKALNIVVGPVTRAQACVLGGLAEGWNIPSQLHEYVDSNASLDADDGRAA
jgi:hypothetical protein